MGRRSEYKAVEKARQRFITTYAFQMRKALIEQGRDAAVAIESGLPNAENFVRSEPVAIVFNQLYSDTGSFFAKRTYRQVTKLQAKDRANDLIATWLDYMRKYVATQVGSRINKITATSQQIVKDVLDKASVEGWGTDKAARELRKKWQAITRARSLVIARTEVLTASNYGSMSGANYVSNTLGVQMQKEWIATLDKRTRDTHKAANGQKRDLNDPFTINGKDMKQPGDPAGGASECVNCRCTVGFIVV